MMTVPAPKAVVFYVDAAISRGHRSKTFSKNAILVLPKCLEASNFVWYLFITCKFSLKGVYNKFKIKKLVKMR